jgi:hypothetical protein
MERKKNKKEAHTFGWAKTLPAGPTKPRWPSHASAHRQVDPYYQMALSARIYRTAWGD